MRKIAYATRAEAMDGRDRTTLHTGDSSTAVFQCTACGYWHIGHLPGKPPGRQRRRKMSRPAAQRDPDITHNARRKGR